MLVARRHKRFSGAAAGVIVGREVQEMFASIAPRYDRANTVLSLGTHGRWRRKTVRASGAKTGAAVLDLATGTGDLAFAFRRRVGAHGTVVGGDFTRAMLLVAKSKAVKRGAADWLVCDAQRVPAPEGRFDVVSIAFGIRNVDDPVACLAEMRRVVKPGGRVVVLEFGQPKGLWGRAFRFYGRHVMPRVGGWITGQRGAYEYLPRTASQFPAGEAFVALARSAASWSEITATPLSGRIAWIYVLTK